MRLEDMAEPSIATASDNIDPEMLGFIPGTKEKKAKGYKKCKLCDGKGKMEHGQFRPVKGGWKTVIVDCPVCLKRRYKKHIKELKGE